MNIITMRNMIAIRLSAAQQRLEEAQWRKKWADENLLRRTEKVMELKAILRSLESADKTEKVCQL